MHKMMGCSRDHAKEIDLYSKDYGSKIERIMKMVEEAQAALQERKSAQQKALEAEKTIDPILEQEFLQKASYYFAQALLVFYYLIPEGDQQEEEVSVMKIEVHKCQANVMLKQSRYQESLSELDKARQTVSMHSERKKESEPEIDLTQAKVLLKLQDYDRAQQLLKDRVLVADTPAPVEKKAKKLYLQIEEAKLDYEKQQRVLYQKMVIHQEKEPKKEEKEPVTEKIEQTKEEKEPVIEEKEPTKEEKEPLKKGNIMKKEVIKEPIKEVIVERIEN